MSFRTSSQMMTNAAETLNANLTQMGAGFSQTDHWELEAFVLLVLNLFETVKESHDVWRGRVEAGKQEYDHKDAEAFALQFGLLDDLFTELDKRIRVMEAARNEHVANCHQIQTEHLCVARLLKDVRVVPVAPVSMAFEELTVDGENEEFLLNFLQQGAGK